MVQMAHHAYSTVSSHANQEQLQIEKDNLEKVYNDLFEEDFNKMIDKFDDANAKAKHGVSWKLINEITRRNASQRGILKGSSAGEN